MPLSGLIGVVSQYNLKINGKEGHSVLEIIVLKPALKPNYCSKTL